MGKGQKIEGKKEKGDVLLCFSPFTPYILALCCKCEWAVFSGISPHVDQIMYLNVWNSLVTRPLNG